MTWFRSKMRPCARLALIALALQLIVSFGHIHRDDLGLPPLAAGDAAHFISATTQVPSAPADQQHGPASDDYCPICASMALLASGVPALPPVLVMPAPILRSWPRAITVKRPSRQAVASFQARGPPLA